MSMTREEAMYWLENGWNHSLEGTYKEAFDIALSALRPVSREQVEKVRGEWRWVGADRWNDCYECRKCGNMHTDDSPFCPACGAPMTDKAVQVVMERLVELHGKAKTD